MAAEKSVLEQALENLANGIKDLTSIEVITLSGKVEWTTDADADALKATTLDWDALLNHAKTDGSVKLVAATRVDADYDVVNFQAESASPELLKLHADTLRTSREGREAIMRLFVDTLRSFLPGGGTGGGG